MFAGTSASSEQVTAELEIQADAVTFRPPRHSEDPSEAEQAITLSARQIRRSELLCQVYQTSLAGLSSVDGTATANTAHLQLQVPLQWDSFKLWLQHSVQTSLDCSSDDDAHGLSSQVVNLNPIGGHRDRGASNSSRPDSSDLESAYDQQAVRVPGRSGGQTKDASDNFATASRHTDVDESASHGLGFSELCHLLVV